MTLTSLSAIFATILPLLAVPPAPAQAPVPDPAPKEQTTKAAATTATPTTASQPATPIVVTSTQPARSPVAPAFIAALNAGKKQTIAYYGTSLTEGGAWVKQVGAALDKAYPGLVAHVNGGGSGQSSAWGVKSIQTRVLDKTPDLVLIEFATNDAVARFKMSKETSRQNWEGMIAQIRKARPACEIVLQIMNPVVGKPEGHASHRDDQPGYEQIVRDVAQAHGLPVIDHSPAWAKVLAESEAAYLKLVLDGVHPGEAGYAKHVTPTILQALGIAPKPAP